MLADKKRTGYAASIIVASMVLVIVLQTAMLFINVMHGEYGVSLLLATNIVLCICVICEVFHIERLKEERDCYLWSALVCSAGIPDLGTIGETRLLEHQIALLDLQIVALEQRNKNLWSILEDTKTEGSAEGTESLEHQISELDNHISELKQCNRNLWKALESAKDEGPC